MNVILREKVYKLGALGQLVRVKPGYARNFLIPQGKALPATEANIKTFELERDRLEKAAEDRFEGLKLRAASLEGALVTLAVQAGEEGHLFGSVTAHDISRALVELGHEATKSEVQLPSGPIRELGEYEIVLRLQGTEVIAKVGVRVVRA